MALRSCCGVSGTEIANGTTRAAAFPGLQTHAPVDLALNGTLCPIALCFPYHLSRIQYIMSSTSLDRTNSPVLADAILPIAVATLLYGAARLLGFPYDSQHRVLNSTMLLAGHYYEAPHDVLYHRGACSVPDPLSSDALATQCPVLA
eukprot:1847596-Rhodomonas_salina.2